MRSRWANGVFESLERHDVGLDQHKERLARLDLLFEQFVERCDRSEADWKEERREMEARIAADRKETAERLAADRKEASERLAAERIVFEQEHKESKREFISQKRWLIATFVTVFVGMSSIFAAFVVLIMQLT